MVAVQTRRSLIVLVVLGAVFCTSGPASARERGCVLPFLPEKGSGAPTWLGHSLSISVNNRLSLLRRGDFMAWLNYAPFYTADGQRPPDDAWSVSELAGIARKCCLRVVVVGRYRLEAGDVIVRCRVLARTGTGAFELRFPLADARSRAADIARRIADCCKWPVGPQAAARMQRPVAASARAFELLGRTRQAWMAQRGKDALRLADEMAKLDTDSPILAIEQWCVRLDSDPREACRWSETAVRSTPDYSYYWALLGDARTQMGDLKGAWSAFKTACNLDPADPSLYAGLAAVEQKSGRVVEAARLRKKAESLCEGWLDHLWLARGFYYDGECAPAVKHLRIALRGGAPRGFVFAALGATYFDMKRWRSAVNAYEESLRISPGNKEAFGYLGYAYMQLHEYQRAEGVLRSAVKANPNDTGARGNLAITLHALGKDDEAIMEMKTLLSIDPKDKYAHKYLARFYRHQRKFLQAAYHDVLGTPRLRKVAGWALLVVGVGAVVVLTMVAIAIRRALAPDGPRSKQDQASAD